MKTLAKISIALACAALLMVGAYLLTSRLGVDSEVSVSPAKSENALLESAKQSGVSLPEDLENYFVVTLRVSLNSYSPFKAQWINLSLKGEDEGAAALSSNAWLKEMPAFGKREGEQALYISFLSPKDSEQRQAQLEYYIFGRYHSVDILTGDAQEGDQ